MMRARGEAQARTAKECAALNPKERTAISAPMLRFGLILAAVVILIDQIAKYLILGPGHFSPPGCLEQSYDCRAAEIFPFFKLSMVWNRGVSFGLMRANTDIVRWALVGLSLLISGVFASWLRTADRRLTAVALGLVIGGAMGNVIDRIRFGAVVDFLDFQPIFVWVFNVADASITIGAILLAVDMLFFTETEPGKGAPWTQIRAKMKGQSVPPGASGG
jgi:signal peptidase II